MLAPQAGSTGVGGGDQCPVCRRKDGLVGAAGRHGELDATHADGDERTDLEQLAANGARGRVGEIGALQSDAAQARDAAQRFSLIRSSDSLNSVRKAR